jgi:thermostable 8-oxoguanine DNA glycosylase
MNTKEDNRITKGFKVNKDIVNRYEELKLKERLTSDFDFFVRMLDCIETAQSKQLVPISMVNEKDKLLAQLSYQVGKLEETIESLKKRSLLQRIFNKF